jgi:molybdopterin converting factor small subunit
MVTGALSTESVSLVHGAAIAARAVSAAKTIKHVSARPILKLPIIEIRYESGPHPSKKECMQIRVLGFAAVREILRAPERELDLPDGARVGDAWTSLERQYPALRAHRASIRVACNGRLVDLDGGLREGDGIALLPPVGGG